MYIDERPSVTVPYDVCALTAHSSTESATPTGGWADYMYIPQHTTLIFTITKCLLDHCMAKNLFVTTLTVSLKRSTFFVRANYKMFLHFFQLLWITFMKGANKWTCCS